ncbi:MAG: Crp/Fnr family transcriptional regulator [Candidatus Devosia phytovorans]|uniref:Crp/Fnr family transcriptional regulator n=1 Tax=Candidatus Devosia phytovorans TaxID=3121372 RepID=A0AAJ6B2E9_9HYPH|nr:Crp/Fnr family transcriptional regulator [Devosia sp.]WEK06354.1 MAG: Crp/Fnr family transcriptional regulator [Devosia sp.]
MTLAIDRLIRRLDAIGQLGPNDRLALQSLPVQYASYQRQDVIIEEGAEPTTACLVIDGFVHRSKLLPNGHRQIFSLHMPGDLPDLHGLYLKTMDHSLVATSACKLALIHHSAIRGLLRASESLTALLWRDTILDSAAFRAWMLMIGQAEADTRMAHLFCELYVRADAVGLVSNDSFPLPVSQIDLADMLGISAVHANRTLQDIRGAGLLNYEKGVVTILRWAELQELAQFDPQYLHLRDDDEVKSVVGL